MLRHSTANILSGAANLPVNSGQFSALFLRVSGTNQAAQTLTAANLGNITAFYKGRPFTSVSFADLQIVNNMDGGAVESASAAGGAFTFSCLLLASRNHDGNIFDVTQADNCQVTIDFSGVTAVIVASGTVELYGIPTEGAMRYIPQLFTYQPSIAASGTDVRQIPLENVAQIYFTTLTNLSLINVDKDGNAYTQASAAALQAFSNIDTQVETGLTTGFMVNLNRTGAISEALSDDVKLTLVAGSGGAAAPYLIVCAIDFTPEKFVQSANAVANAADVRFQKKAQAGKTRPVTVAKLVSGAPASSAQ